MSRPGRPRTESLRRQTETWWQQATGEAIVGALVGSRLTAVEAQLISWKEASQQYPDAVILSQDTGHDRPYGRNPYRGYDGPGQGPFQRFFTKDVDRRLPAMERVVAIQLAGTAVAYPFSRLQRDQVVEDRVGSEPVAIFWAPGTASAVDLSDFGQGREVGAVGVYDARLDQELLRFEALGEGRFRDLASGSIWNLVGRAESGRHAGRQLRAIPHGNHFWFAWAAFRPDTRLALK